MTLDERITSLSLNFLIWRVWITIGTKRQGEEYIETYLEWNKHLINISDLPFYEGFVFYISHLCIIVL